MGCLAFAFWATVHIDVLKDAVECSPEHNSHPPLPQPVTTHRDPTRSVLLLADIVHRWSREKGIFGPSTEILAAPRLIPSGQLYIILSRLPVAPWPREVLKCIICGKLIEGEMASFQLWGDGHHPEISLITVVTALRSQCSVSKPNKFWFSKLDIGTLILL